MVLSVLFEFTECVAIDTYVMANVNVVMDFIVVYRKSREKSHMTVTRGLCLLPK